MQSVYIDNKNKVNNFEILKDYLKQTDNTKVPNYFFYFFSSQNKESIFKKKDDLIANLGVFIYKNFYNQKALELFYQDLESGFSVENLLKSSNTRGQFALILYYKNFHLI